MYTIIRLFSAMLLLLHITSLLTYCAGSGFSQNPAQPAPNLHQPAPESAAYIKYYNDYIPVSLVSGDRQLLKNTGPEWYFTVQAQHGLPDTISSPPAGASRHQIADSYSSPINPLTTPNPWDENHWSDYAAMEELYIVGDWQPFPLPVRYESYTPDNQPTPHPAWVSHFRELLGDAAADTPLLIKDAYYFDIDGDGREEAIVNATNLIRLRLDSTEANRPANQECTSYMLTSYFAGTGQVLNLSSYISTDPNRPASQQDEVWYAYQPPTQAARNDPQNPDYWYEQFFAAYQYNSAGQPTPAPLYVVSEYDPWRELLVLLADLDGDGRPELITASTFIYWPIQVYSFTPGAPLPTLQFSVNTPA